MLTRHSQRGLGRVVMLNHVRGQSLTKFYHLVELFGAFQDAAQGHKDLYGKGIHHRNINHNSILLTGDPTPGQRALIVHLDNSSDMEGSAFYDDEHRETLAFVSYEILSGEPYFENVVSTPVLVALDSLSFGVGIEDAIPATTDPSNTEGIPHAAVHDLESFFWVFCWLCMTREGPGKKRVFKAEGLTPEAVTTARQAQMAIHETFENGFTIREKKREPMTKELAFRRGILASFTTYFEPAKQVALYLYRILQKAYRERKFDGLHDVFIKVFKIATETPAFINWHVKKSDYTFMEKAARRSRERDEDVSNSPQPERVGGMEKVSRAARTKRRRSMDKVEAMEEKSDEDQEDESAPASSSPSNRQGRKKRAKTASSSHAPSGTQTAGATAQSNSSSQRTAGGRKKRQMYGKKNNRR